MNLAPGSRVHRCAAELAVANPGRHTYSIEGCSGHQKVQQRAKELTALRILERFRTSDFGITGSAPARSPSGSGCRCSLWRRPAPACRAAAPPPGRSSTTATPPRPMRRLRPILRDLKPPSSLHAGRRVLPAAYRRPHRRRRHLPNKEEKSLEYVRQKKGKLRNYN